MALSSWLRMVKVANGEPLPSSTVPKIARAELRAGIVGKCSSENLVSRGEIEAQSVAAHIAVRIGSIIQPCNE